MIPLMAVLPKFDLFDKAGAEPQAEGNPAAIQSMRLRTILLSLITFAIVIASGTLWALYAVIGQQAGLPQHEVNDAIALSIGTAFVGTLLPALLGGKVGRNIPTCVALVSVACRPQIMRLARSADLPLSSSSTA